MSLTTISKEMNGGIARNRVNHWGETPLNKVLWNSFHFSYIPIAARLDKQGLAEMVKLLINAGSEPNEDYWYNVYYLKLFAQM